MLIYHLVRSEDWELALGKGVYKPESLASEGFIHFSTKEQLLKSAELFFQDVEELIVLEVSDKQIKSDLKWEQSEKGELFPHLYCKLAIEKVGNTHMLLKKKDGAWTWV